MSTDLILFSAAREALARAARVDEVKDVRDEAERLKLYARQAKDRGLMADAMEIQLRAERKLGELLIAAKAAGQLSQGGRPRTEPTAAKAPATAPETRSREEPVSERVTLAEAGIDRKLSMKAQQLAAVPEKAFEVVLDRAREKIVSGGGIVVNPAKDITQAEKVERRAGREAELGARQQALPDKRFGVIYADPEWRFEPYSRDSGMDRAADNHYPTSELETIKARDVASIAADDCVLFLWATAPMLPQALEVMSAWGFKYKSQAVWHKQRVGDGRGTGYWFLGEHELLLVGTRGNIPAPAQGTQWRSHISAPVGDHSEKPTIFQALIEAYFPSLPKIELNARAARPGWEVWGNQAPEPGDHGNAGHGGQHVGRSDEEQHDEASVPSADGRGESPDAGDQGQGAGAPRDDREPGVVAGNVDREDEDRGSRHVGGEAPNAVASYVRLVAADTLKGRHTPASAEPIVRAAYGSTPPIPVKQLAEDLGHKLGTVLSWASRFGLGSRDRQRAAAMALNATRRGAQ